MVPSDCSGCLQQYSKVDALWISMRVESGYIRSHFTTWTYHIQQSCIGPWRTQFLLNTSFAVNSPLDEWPLSWMINGPDQKHKLHSTLVLVLINRIVLAFTLASDSTIWGPVLEHSRPIEQHNLQISLCRVRSFYVDLYPTIPITTSDAWVTWVTDTVHKTMDARIYKAQKCTPYQYWLIVALGLIRFCIIMCYFNGCFKSPLCFIKYKLQAMSVERICGVLVWFVLFWTWRCRLTSQMVLVVGISTTLATMILVLFHVAGATESGWRIHSTRWHPGVFVIHTGPVVNAAEFISFSIAIITKNPFIGCSGSSKHRIWKCCTWCTSTHACCISNQSTSYTCVWFQDSTFPWCLELRMQRYVQQSQAFCGCWIANT